MIRQEVIEEANSIVDTYHALPPMPDLLTIWQLRRNLVHVNHQLARLIKSGYGKQELTDVQRRYLIAREITKALDDDLGKLKSARRPFNQIEIRTEALDYVLQRRKEAVEAEAEYEELKALIKSVDHCLRAMMQEISESRKQHADETYTGETP